MSQPFIHLRVHSSYSLSEGAVKIDDLISKAVENKMPAVAITDSNNLFASLEFSTKAAKAGLQPIIGCIVNIDPQLVASAHEKTVIDSILLIAKNKQGYQNLLKIASESYIDSKNLKENCINFDLLKKYSDGIIALAGGERETVRRLVLEKKNSKAEKYLLSLKKVFGDRLYLELNRHRMIENRDLEKVLIDFAMKHDIQLVATNNVYFLNRDMHEAHEVLMCISDGTYISQDVRRRSSPENYFKNSAEMQKLFEDVPEALDNTINIAKRCSVMSEENEIIFPDYTVTVGQDQADELRILSERGLEVRLKEEAIRENWSKKEIEDNRQIYFERLKYELDVIIGMKFPGYFLIVSDFIKWSKNNDIPVGPGRGSGAGSVVAWSLDITDVDPIKFGLLFERFLNPERVSMPDFDIDFCQERREEVIQYVRSKYGDDKVAQIITFGKLQARAVVRDVGRVLQMPYNQVDRISKMIPFNAVNPINLSQAIEMEPELKAAKNRDHEIEKLLDISLKLEGLNRHASTHAAGIVISNKSLDAIVPLYKDQKSEMPAIQYSMKYAEAVGLIKFDFLGLKTLTVISKAAKLIKKILPDFDIRKIPLDDKKTFEMLGRGDSVGVFQFESPGMRDALRKMKPDSIYDINALGALYRPGPMDNIPTYIACKHGRQEPNYLHEKLKNTLLETFGVIIYQEQVMEIARLLSGYTLGAADLLRRAMGKKIKSEMDAQREMFVKGAVENKVKESEAKSIFDLVAKFAGYGFNKSHATAYGLISYQTAYIKANYPVEMMVALLNNDIDDTDKINVFIDEAKEMGIEILAPDVNSSTAEFSVSYDENGKGKIIYGLGGLKNVGLAAMKELVEERNQDGKYADLWEFIRRSSSKVVNKRQLESIIKSGALDQFWGNRNQLVESIPIITSYHSSHTENRDANQIDLFSFDKSDQPTPKFYEAKMWSNRDKLDNECQAFGFYFNEHPLATYQELFKTRDIADAAYIKNELAEGYSSVKIAAIPISVKTRVSPRGRYVSCMTSTPTGMVDIAIFNDDILEKNRDFLYNKVPLLIEADIRKDDGGSRVSARNIVELDKYLADNLGGLSFYINNPKGAESVYKILKGYENNEGYEIKIKSKVNKKIVSLALEQKYKIDLTEIDMNNLPEGIEKIDQS
ncbi:MAG: DNA polymerase III subunit alpha [Rickettsiales bacterium]